ncbi:LANO_0F03818g1_1 [Lachancea nothofagi CBS 11611]|uniref:LANO_0F03818g1_1 n=1 Tax=Lachancea nothofagi CBS 11611 TaxID=1266666 RepID=A0A1G4K7B8_9SACH|nr:LANO_0F03818g1_1 [Lachancea nothofagi CBS 11611]
MEFFYEEQAVGNGLESAQDQPEGDKSTEEAFQKFEGTIDRQYQKTAEVVKKFMNEERSLELNVPLEPHLSERAQVALDSLDHQLHNVENLAQDYWKKVSSNSFWSSMTDSLGSKFGEAVNVNSGKKDQDETPLNSRAKIVTPVAGNRTDAELRLLSSDERVYLNNESSLTEGFDVDKHTSEIAALLESDKVLTQTMNAVVPEKISYSEFWNIFFSRRDNILAMEHKRKKLLEQKAQDGTPVDWDEEEDDNDNENKEVDIEIDGASAREESTSKKDTDVKESKGSGHATSGKSESAAEDNDKRSANDENNDDDDDDDDDWE